MEKTKKEALDEFLGNEKTPKKTKNSGAKKIIMKEREGLIERVDPVYVTKEGKQLLREQY